MGLFEGLSSDQLSRIATVSKWITVVLAVLVAVVGILHQWASDRVSALHKAEKAAVQVTLNKTQVELEKTKSEAKETAEKLSRISTPRSLSAEQRSSLKSKLCAGPKGIVRFTYLSIERDAESYAKQIAEVFSECGFDTAIVDKIWLQLAFDDIFLCVVDVSNPPVHAAAIQQSFVSSGIRLRAHQDPGMCKSVDAPENGVVIVISNRA